MTTVASEILLGSIRVINNGWGRNGDALRGETVDMFMEDYDALYPVGAQGCICTDHRRERMRKEIDEKDKGNE